MFGRFIIQKLSSRMSRSTSRLGGHVPTSASAGAPVTRTAPPARSYFNTVACSHVKARTSWPVKRPFSSTAVKKREVSSEAKKAPQNMSTRTNFDELFKTADTTMVLSACMGIGYVYMLVSIAYPDPDDSTRCCKCHCNCPCHSPKPEVEQKE